PQLLASRRAGAGEQNARLDALLAIMSQLTDTCVLHRAGLEGLERMQQGARAVLAAGGAASLAGRRQLRALDHAMLALNASPGGAGADWAQLIMETRSFECAAGQPARGKALVGVVGSGDLEVLLEPGQAGKLAIQVVTSVNGAEQRWQQLFERMFREQTLPAL